MEIWKAIKGWEDKYLISSLGRVKSIRRLVVQRGGNSYFIKERILSSSNNNHGYRIVHFGTGERKGYLIHRLVAIHFIANPNNLPEVNHLDGDKSNCSIDNLEWATRKENMRHASENMLFRNGATHHKSRIVVNTETGIFYNCIREAANSVGATVGKLKCRLREGRNNNTSFIYA